MNQNLSESEKQLMYNKKFPTIFNDSFLKALSYFPELHDTYVLIKETQFYGVQHTLRAYPPLVNLHWKKQNWVYPIVVNKNKNINLSFYDVPFEEQVGFFVHELSHIAYYINFKRRDMLLFAIKYAFNKNFVKKIERETDLRVVERGAGLYLISERIFLFNFRQNKPYAETADTYITPNELVDSLKNYPTLYSNEKIELYLNKLQKAKEKSKVLCQTSISISRKIKHSLKTIFGFIPGFLGMFYIITIKKFHLK